MSKGETMNNQSIADFESEILSVCGKYEKKMPHACLVGVLTVVTHMYMDAQLSNADFYESPVLKGRKASPVPAEAVSGGESYEP